MVFTNLTFRALGRTHIASEPCVAIAMLCFDSTVGFPWSVPVLKQRLLVRHRHPYPVEGLRGTRACAQDGPARQTRGAPRGGNPSRQHPAQPATDHESPHSTPAFGPDAPDPAPASPGEGKGRRGPQRREETSPSSRPGPRRTPSPTPVSLEDGDAPDPRRGSATPLSEPLLLPKLRS